MVDPARDWPLPVRVAVTIGERNPQAYNLDAGQQMLVIELPASPDAQFPLRLSFKVRGWVPGNGDTRELGMAIQALDGQIKSTP